MSGSTTYCYDHHDILRAFPIRAVRLICEDVRQTVPDRDWLGFRHGIILCGRTVSYGEDRRRPDSVVAAKYAKSGLQGFVAGFAGLTAANTGLLDDQQPFGVVVPDVAH